MLKHKPDFTAQRLSGSRYFERWKAMRTNGAQVCIISRSANPGQWQAWRAYYRLHGLLAMLDLMDDGRAEKAVPCLDPADFEPQLASVGPDRRVKDD